MQRKWKPVVFNYVVVSKLIYGLESLQLHKRTFNRIDTFQMRGIRTILNIPPTFVDREYSDDKVLETANELITDNGTETNVRHMIKLSSLLEQRRKPFLGHMIRADDQYITRHVTFTKHEPALLPSYSGNTDTEAPDEYGLNKLWTQPGPISEHANSVFGQ